MSGRKEELKKLLRKVCPTLKRMQIFAGSRGYCSQKEKQDKNYETLLILLTERVDERSISSGWIPFRGMMDFTSYDKKITEDIRQVQALYLNH
jgi:hypothetical protein